ncbi:MAG: tetratricopeptide repeat protein [Planctomycetaceae bacterium]
MTTPATVDGLLDKAKKSSRERDFDAAIQCYQEVLALDEHNVAAHEGLAAAAFMAKNYDLAIQHFQRVSMVDPRRSQAIVNLGAVYNRKGDFNSAVQALRRALAKDRKSAEAYYNLGIAHRGLNQLSMAVSAYKEAIRLNPEMAEAYQNLANVFVEMGNTHQAILHYQRALDIRPDFEKAVRGLERARSTKKELDKTVSPFGRLVDINKVKKAGESTKVRELSETERYEDRLAVHALAKDALYAARDVHENLESALEPHLQEFTRAFNQSKDARGFWDEFQAMSKSFQDFEELVDSLGTQTGKLRKHNEEILALLKSESQE